MNPSNKLLEKLSDFVAWRGDKKEFDLLDYVQCVATPDLLFGFLELLHPTLICHEGNYFLASHFDPVVYDNWIKRLSDPIEVQKVMNHLHVSSLFQQQDISDYVALETSRQLARCWSKAFADKSLVAEAYGDTFEDAEVTLFRRP